MFEHKNLTMSAACCPPLQSAQERGTHFVGCIR